MDAIHITKVVTKSGSIVLDNLPFAVGEEVEIVIERKAVQSPLPDLELLKGSLLEYSDPYAPVAEDDWDSNYAVGLEHPGSCQLPG